MKEYQFSPEEFRCLEELRIPMAVYQFLDKRVVVRVLSAGFCDLFEFDSREEAYEVMSRDMYSTAHPDDAARIADEAYRFATQGGRFEVVYRIRARKSPSYKLIHAQGEHVFRPGGRLAFVWYTDEGSYTGEGDAQRAELVRNFRSALSVESMVRENYYDFLTGLPTMSHFFELVEAGREAQSQRGAMPAVLFLDLNGMRQYNRKYGFSQGDELLIRVSKVLAAHFGSENCSRFGQDHFAVSTSSNGLEDKLRSIIRQCEALRGGRDVSVRIGVYLDRQGGVEPSFACDRARIACEQLSHYGSGYRFFDESMLVQADDRQYIIDNLDRALTEGWIRVYYQPIVRAVNGRVCDEEALARWIDPARGLVSPGNFIPALEDAGLVYKLDLYVLERTLEKMRQRQDAGLTAVPQSVNLSRADFDVCDMVEEVRRRVDESGVERGLVNVEITESVVGRDFAFMKEQLERFQQLGFPVWMDDFGSGYSSLDVLQSTHFNLIKFDMRFMQRFSERSESRIILTELVRLAGDLGIETVCEGVETKEQVDFLREIGCSKLQGFYFSRPQPASALEELYSRADGLSLEDPQEADYYAAVGRINLYDTAVFAQSQESGLGRYLDAIPMALIESDGERFTILRCNHTYRSFMTGTFGVCLTGVPIRYDEVSSHGSKGLGFLAAMRQCGLDGRQLVVDEDLPNGQIIHAVIKRVSEDARKGAAALAVAVLSLGEKRDEDKGLSYLHIAKALSADYYELFYVDMDTEDYVRYSSASQQQDLTVEEHGTDFFALARESAVQLICPDDLEYLQRSFTRENVLRALDTTGTFGLTYRMLVDGKPVYMSMKGVRMGHGDSHIIIGVSNVDAQVRDKEIMARLHAEQATYARVLALTGDYLCIYTIDPETGHYLRYSSTQRYDRLGIAEEGDDFFATSRENAYRVFYPDDVGRFLTIFTKENIMAELQRSGIFTFQYRLMLENVPTYVCIKAVLSKEEEKTYLIMGLINVDEQVRREQGYEHDLAVARTKMHLDPLTGVKNRQAFEEAERLLELQIREGEPKDFAVVVFDVHGLEEINFQRGHREGDLYLKRACAVICDLFKHSPVYRLEEDSFAVIARGRDLEQIQELLAQLARRNEKNAAAGGIRIACGMDRYEPGESATAVYERAYDRMWKHKKEMEQSAGPQQ